MGKKVVIIGGVAGGASCAARLRRLDEEAEIVILERGEYISYANCGLPYRTGDVIRTRQALILQTPEAMRAKFNIDVRVKNEVLSIDREKKLLSVRRKDSGEIYEESYDTLVIATGSSPMRPPIPGIDSDRILTLWTVSDTDRILSRIREEKAKSVAIIGGGFIGLEMAENMRQAGLSVTIVEMLDQVMAPLDYEMAALLHENIRANGVRLLLNNGVQSFHELNGQEEIRLQDGTAVTADFVLLSIGVRPNGQLAKEAGLSVNARGGIITDKSLRTSDPSIYAVGDVIEVDDLIFGGRTMIPLAGPANKQGRMAADNIAGGNEQYEGTLGSAVAKVFDLTAASTGANEKTLKKRGLIRGKDYEQIIIMQNSHAAYYPGAVPMTIKLLFSMDGKKIFGAQIVGRDGVDKRIDTLSVVIRMNGGIRELESLELSYAPPYSSAKDPVNMAGFTAANVLDGLVSIAEWDAADKADDAVLLDVREDAELTAYSIPRAVHIPLGKLRERFSELNPEKKTIVFCAIGVRAYNAARILMNHGFRNVRVYPGGARFFRSVHAGTASADPGPAPADGSAAGPAGSAANSSLPPAQSMAAADAGAVNGSAAPKQAPVSSIRLDCCGMQCPGPIMKVFEAIKGMKEGDVLEVAASDPGFSADIASWCRRTGNSLLSNEKRGNDYVATLKKGNGILLPEHAGCSLSGPGAQGTSPVPAVPEGKTIIVFSGDLDKVLASFIIANGAAAMGRPVTMFFTFWGLTALRKSKKQPVRKTFMESVFGTMLPRGTGKLRLSKMNMGGMGTAMMKKIMQDKNVDSLEALMKKAMDAGVKLIACTMSMDVMGIKKEELIDGVELGGVGTYLGDAEESNVNLFI